MVNFANKYGENIMKCEKNKEKKIIRGQRNREKLVEKCVIELLCNVW
jgi:hypothetical protein